MNLANVAEEIQHRIIHIFGRDVGGRRASNGGNQRLDFDPHFRDYVWFYEVRFRFEIIYSICCLFVPSPVHCIWRCVSGADIDHTCFPVVFPRGRWPWAGRVASDGMVGSRRASYSAERSELSVAKDAKECVHNSLFVQPFCFD